MLICTAFIMFDPQNGNMNGKKRPVLILNKTPEYYDVIPLTTKINKRTDVFILHNWREYSLHEKSGILLKEIFRVHPNLINLRPLGRVSEREFSLIIELIKDKEIAINNQII